MTLTLILSQDEQQQTFFLSFQMTILSDCLSNKELFSFGKWHSIILDDI